MSYVHAFPMHTYSISIYLLYLNCFGAFLIVCFSLPLLLLTIVVSMAPKHKSTPAWNALRSKASSSSNSASISLRFRDDDAHKAFSEKFSRRGIHSECQVILADFANIDLPMSFTVGDGSHCVTIRSPVLSFLSGSFTPTCTGLIIQYLFSSLVFEVCAYLSHLSLLRICFGFLG